MTTRHHYGKKASKKSKQKQRGYENGEVASDYGYGWNSLPSRVDL